VPVHVEVDDLVGRVDHIDLGIWKHGLGMIDKV
jgi:hypothetical protein